MPIDRHECVCRLALQRIFFQYPLIARRLILAAGTASAFFAIPKEKFRPWFARHDALWKKFTTFTAWDACEQDLVRSQSEGIALVWEGAEGFPLLLAQLAAPPVLLMMRGNRPDAFVGPTIAIVGSRKATNAAKKIAFDLAAGFAQAGVTVVSGMAFGIDAAAHAGALAHGGATIAVWGTGIDRPYPHAHIPLAARIRAQGIVASEFPLGTAARPEFFPQRNRIISGLSLGVIIVEAAAGSGSLITARFALEQGREVFAVPGRAAHCTTAGSDGLLDDGATPITSVAEVLAALVPQLRSSLRTKTPGHSPELPAKERRFFKTRNCGRILSLEEYAVKSGKGVGEALVELSRLLLAGIIVELPGRRYRWKE